MSGESLLVGDISTCSDIVQEPDKLISGHYFCKLALTAVACEENPDTSKATETNAHEKVSDHPSLSIDEIRKIHDRFGHPDLQRLLKLCGLFSANHQARESDARRVIQDCELCKKTNKIEHALLNKELLPKRPRESLTVTQISPYAKDINGFVALLCIQDNFSKHTALYPCKTMTHDEIAERLRTYLMIIGANTVNEVNATRFFESNGILKDLSTEFKFKWNFIEAESQSSSEEKNYQTSIQTLTAWVIEKLNGDTNNWSDYVHQVAMLANSLPHPSHGFPPELVQFGSITNGLYLDPSSTQLVPEMRKLWKHVEEKLIKTSLDQEKGIAGPFKRIMLKPGDKVFATLSKGVNIKAKVLHDYGDSVWIEKENAPARFKRVVVHKSQLAKRLEFD